MPFNEIVELIEIFFDSGWFAKLINTFQNGNEPIINEVKQIMLVSRIKMSGFLIFFFTIIFVKSDWNSCFDLLFLKKFLKRLVML